MRSFINAVLEASGDKLIGEILSIRSEVVYQSVVKGYKRAMLDVQVIAAGNVLINIEVQLRSPGYNMINRSLFYASNMFQKSVESGVDYSQMSRVIVINILGYHLNPNRNSHYLQPVDLVYRTAPNGIATDLFCIYNIELLKYKRLVKEPQTLLEKWIYVFTKGVTEPEHMKEVIGMDAGLNQFLKRYKTATRDPKTQEKAFALIMAESDAISERNADLRKYEAKGREEGLKEGLKEGREEGLAEGREEANLATAHNMLSHGIAPEMIATFTGLPIEKITCLE
jgi:predicted transposase/invertase (TIGR01784 family)